MIDPNSRPMSIKGPYENERARLDGTFTDLDREWRKKWLKAQELGHHEPRTQFSASQMEMNPIRRAYRFPLDYVFSKLQSRLVSSNNDNCKPFSMGSIPRFQLKFYKVIYELQPCYNLWIYIINIFNLSVCLTGRENSDCTLLCWQISACWMAGFGSRIQS